MKYKMRTPEADRPIDFCAYVKFPDCVLKENLTDAPDSILSMRMEDEQTTDTEATEDNYSGTPYTSECVEDLGVMPLSVACSEDRTVVEEEELIASPIRETDDTTIEHLPLTHDNTEQDRGNDISFDIPLISVKYT